MMATTVNGTVDGDCRGTRDLFVFHIEWNIFSVQSISRKCRIDRIQLGVEGVEVEEEIKNHFHRNGRCSGEIAVIIEARTALGAQSLLRPLPTDKNGRQLNK